MAVAVLLAVHRLLPHACLNILVHVAVGQSQHQAVGPGLVHQSGLGHDGFVVVGVVEAAHVLQPFVVEGARLEVFYRSVYVIVVVRIVLECVHFIGKAVLERLPEVHVRPVRVERPVAVRRVQKPGTALLVCHDVDDAPYGIRAEAHGHHALVYLDALGKVHGDVVQPERTAHALLRHPVDEHLDVLAAEAVQHQLHVRPHAASLPQFHARRLCQGFAEALGGVLHLARVHRHGVEGRTFQPAHPVGHHDHLVQRMGISP